MLQKNTYPLAAGCDAAVAKRVIIAPQRALSAAPSKGALGKKHSTSCHTASIPLFCPPAQLLRRGVPQQPHWRTGREIAVPKSAPAGRLAQLPTGAYGCGFCARPRVKPLSQGLAGVGNAVAAQQALHQWQGLVRCGRLQLERIFFIRVDDLRAALLRMPWAVCAIV